jgi:hypothetical protein
VYVRFSKFGKKERGLLIRSFVVLILCFLPWLLFVFSKLFTNSGSFWFPQTTLVDFLQIPLVLLTGFDLYQKYYSNLLFFSSLISLILLIMVLRQSHFRKQKYYLPLLLLGFPMVIVIMIFSLIKPIITPRYIIGFAGIYTLFIIIGISFYQRLLRYTLLTVLLIVFISYGSLQMVYRRKGNIRETVHIVESLMSKGDAICVDERYANGYLLVSYYAKKHEPYLCFDRNFQIPKFEGSVLYQKAQYLKGIPRFPNKAYIIYSDEQYDIHTIW